MADICAYEERKPDAIAKMKSGYPRFVIHPFIVRLGKEVVRGKLASEVCPFFCATRDAAEQLVRYAAAGRGEIRAIDSFFVALLPRSGEIEERARRFLQHTGVGISSREAEDALLRRGLRKNKHAEPVRTEAPDLYVREALHRFYGSASADDIILCRGGMNAFYAGFLALRDIQAQRGRHIWIQLGWLYVDTIRILEKFSANDTVPRPFYNVFDLGALKAFLKDHGRSVAGIVTEVPNNPLVQSCDVLHLHALAREFGCALILDPTIASPHNVNLLRFADVHINSLTKYAGMEADTLVGALALNRDSPFYTELRETARLNHTPPYQRDLERLAYQIDGYGDLVTRVNTTTEKVVAHLQNHPAIERIWWAYADDSCANYQRIATPHGGPGSMLSFTLRKPFGPVYDRFRFVKGPSFGARFTILSPFLYLAHYDLVSEPKGRAFFESIGMPPDLLRLSVGLEPVNTILEELDRALAD